MPRSSRAIVISLFVIAVLMSGLSYAADPAMDSPQSTLHTYIEALRRGDLATIERVMELRGDKFNLPGPIPIASYTIIKVIIYEKMEVHKWNSQGIIPAAELGDVELQTEEITDESPQMYSYNFRKIGNVWKIISHSAWDVD